MTPHLESAARVLAEPESAGRVRAIDVSFMECVGLRILTFHETLSEDMRRIQARGVRRSRFVMATPPDARDRRRRWPHDTDESRVTFDDGWESNYEMARWLAGTGCPPSSWCPR